MTDPVAKTEPAPAPDTSTIADKDSPQDFQGEFNNAIDLAAGLLSGEIKPRQVANTLLEKVFGAVAPKAEPTKPPATKLGVINGGK